MSKVPYQWICCLHFCSSRNCVLWHLLRRRRRIRRCCMPNWAFARIVADDKSRGFALDDGVAIISAIFLVKGDDRRRATNLVVLIKSRPSTQGDECGGAKCSKVCHFLIAAKYILEQNIYWSKINMYEFYVDKKTQRRDFIFHYLFLKRKEKTDQSIIVLFSFCSLFLYIAVQ